MGPKNPSTTESQGLIDAKTSIRPVTLRGGLSAITAIIRALQAPRYQEPVFNIQDINPYEKKK